MEMQRVAVVGAGAIGGWLAGALAGAGADVSLLARGPTLKALQEHGLRTRHGQRETTHRLKAHHEARALGPQDLVVLAVKAPALAAVAPQVRALLGPDTVVLTAMNGVPWWFLHGLNSPLRQRSLHSVDATGGIAAAIPPGRVIGGVVHASCSVDAPGVVRQHFGNKLIVGEPDGEDTPRLLALAALLRRAGLEVEVSPRIQRDIWFKLWGNMTMNPISALTGATTDRILGDPDVRALVSAVMLEARAIGEKIGLPIEQEPEDRHAVTLKLGAFKTSMLQDVEAGRPVELDALLGAVIELGQLTTTAMPFTRALMGLARVHAQVRGLY
ncbi:2-dehydropantoate 2-reductase [Hydrogenophaga sp. OTU3427]|uniref:2-dehydropantoate 2-reductase n=1 Tax=Hydrogenophaga sp. OTU3427 TaxID=3043856 RepID=UPI00313B445E